jgi:hypothetical protein
VGVGVGGWVKLILKLTQPQVELEAWLSFAKGVLIYRHFLYFLCKYTEEEKT